MRVALLALAGISLSGCFSAPYYGRVGTSAYEHLYRGTPEELGNAVKTALSGHGYAVGDPEMSGETLSITGSLTARELVNVKVRPGQEGLTAVRIDPSVDWKQAVDIHHWIAVELGVLWRRNP